ncbi:MAG: SOS response-associated peptidase [Synergistaceae bacterium]|jgi:putative SOS response-associated peptidase YedK|nr:SOS response-associated peptidase [Synergistaceae bacterium]
MCGRFYINIDEKAMKEIVEAAERSTPTRSEPEIKFDGEIFPTDVVPVQTGVREYRGMKWGFAGFDSKPVINARSETALTKPTFRESMLQRRCLIPASGYFEWLKSGRKKNKYKFFQPTSLIFMAGCWRVETGLKLPSFVILTRAATPELNNFHNRMPVIIPRERAESWLQNSPEAMNTPVLELAYREAESPRAQGTLFPLLPDENVENFQRQHRCRA